MFRKLSRINNERFFFRAENPYPCKLKTILGFPSSSIRTGKKWITTSIKWKLPPHIAMQQRFHPSMMIPGVDGAVDAFLPTHRPVHLPSLIVRPSLCVHHHYGNDGPPHCYRSFRRKPLGPSRRRRNLPRFIDVTLFILSEIGT